MVVLCHIIHLRRNNTILPGCQSTFTIFNPTKEKKQIKTGGNAFVHRLAVFISGRISYGLIAPRLNLEKDMIYQLNIYLFPSIIGGER